MPSSSDDLPRVEPTPLDPPPGSFEAVRRRARQRRHGRGAAVGGGLVAVLALATVGALTLSSSDGQRNDSLVAVDPTAGPTTSTSPSPALSPLPTSSAGPTSVPRPTAATASPPSGTSPAPVPPSPEPAPPTAVLLDAAAVTSAVGGDWTAGSDSEVPFPLLMPCPEGSSPASEGVFRAFTQDAVLLQQQLLRYPDADAARAALQRLVEEVRRCPTREADSEDGQASVDHALRSATSERAAVLETSRDCDTCTESRYELLFAVVDRSLVLLRTNDADLPLPKLLDAATR